MKTLSLMAATAAVMTGTYCADSAMTSSLNKAHKDAGDLGNDDRTRTTVDNGHLSGSGSGDTADDSDGASNRLQHGYLNAVTAIAATPTVQSS